MSMKGRPVMISRNDSALGLFNSDIGVAAGTGRAAGLVPRCRMAALNQCSQVVCRAHGTRLGDDGAHKSRVRFDHAALILPTPKSLPLVTRSWSIPRSRGQNSGSRFMRR